MIDFYAASSVGTKRINVIQGEHFVSRDHDVVLCTILGSCVAACLWDPEGRIGGMNHFLLPGDSAAWVTGGATMRYGAFAMELLINDLLRHGARRDRFKAKVFGGACMMQGLTDIGKMNAEFAERFLAAEGIEIVGRSLRGNLGRRVQFWPVIGRARQTLVGKDQADVIRTEHGSTKLPANNGTVELF